ncbi:methyltransferase [Paracoccus sp. Z330]|uniref:Methyltransferase n=1 Tax=Paracoccus onchidii TaxID=3017813 RepID=A0ABT4ZBM1_9RHOB|nr:methyltransferase [Paracoccus onchidii]MDB6176767.1 methyltransferase [Paracoccus onchidii]
MTELREDGFLGGRLRIAQPVRGYRSGADAVMLAAACPAVAGQSVLELGCGAGVASLCLGWRVPGLRLVGLEQQADFAALARNNARTNEIGLEVITGDLERPPSGLRSQSFDQVIANPPYFLSGTPAPQQGRAVARQERTSLSAWIDAGLRRLRPGGGFTLIQRADRLDDVLAGFRGRAGAISVLPVASRMGRDAGRVLVMAQKGARTPLRLLAPLIMHAAPMHDGDREDLTTAARDILREGKPITWVFTKVS